MSKLEKEDRRFVIGMLSPTAFVFFAGVFIPLLYGLFLSFYFTNKTRQVSVFYGLGNYVDLLFGNASANFYRVYSNTIFFTVVSVSVELILGLLIALLINKSFKGRGFVRAAVLVPWAVPTIVNAQLWNYMFRADQFGLVNNLLQDFGVISKPITFTTEGDHVFINFIFLISIFAFIIGIIAFFYNLFKALYNKQTKEFVESRMFIYLIIMVVLGFIFSVILPVAMGLDRVYGYSNAILGGSPLTMYLPSAMVVILMIDIWKTTPFMALLILASLQVIPQDLYKAASVDGATSFQQFRHITLPLIRPGIGVALIFRCIDAFRIYDILSVITTRVIQSITVLAVQDELYGNPGQAAAVAVITFLNILVFTFIFFYFTRRRTEL